MFNGDIARLKGLTLQQNRALQETHQQIQALQEALQEAQQQIRALQDNEGQLDGRGREGRNRAT